jgi:hypothetical protein
MTVRPQLMNLDLSVDHQNAGVDHYLTDSRLSQRRRRLTFTGNIDIAMKINAHNQSEAY